MDEIYCSICYENNTNYSTPCNHTFHLTCLEQWSKHCHDILQIAKCPLCRKELEDPVNLNLPFLFSSNSRTTNPIYDYSLFPNNYNVGSENISRLEQFYLNFNSNLNSLNRNHIGHQQL